jgi:hypothetical protein
MQMNYRDPANVNAILSAEYRDHETLADWSRTDIALATRAKLVIPRADGNFAPATGMTRGEAALLMHRLYMRLW